MSVASTRSQDPDSLPPQTGNRASYGSGTRNLANSHSGRRFDSCAARFIARPSEGRSDRSAPRPVGFSWTAHAAATSALVFPDRVGGHADARNIRRRVWDKAAATAGIPGARFHDLRHTYGSRLFAGGWNVLAISRVLGHHSASFTLRTYIHCLSDDLPDVDVIDRATGHRLDTDSPDTVQHGDAPSEPETAPLQAFSV